MNKKPRDITRALDLLAKGEYSKVISLLEPKVPLYRENSEFYTILAKALFYTGDYAGSKLYFDTSQRVAWNIDNALFLAVLGLKRREYKVSLRIWLDILDEDPGNKMAKKGLEYLKQYSTLDELDYFIQSNKVNNLIPRRRIKLALSTKITFIVIIAILAGTFTVYKTGLYNKILDLFIESESVAFPDRTGVDDFDLTEFNSNYLDYSTQSVYSFSSAQIEEYFNIASTLFQEGKDNRVKSYLNLIKYSNANEEIKNRAATLESYLKEPEWGDYSDTITFNEVTNDLYQYDGCLIKWKGRLSNLEIKDKKIHFTFLVGYDSGTVLDGVVRVELNENVKIQENQPIEVLGRVTPESNSFYIEAVTIMQYVIRN